MNENKEIWEIWLENKERADSDFQKYLKSKTIKPETETKELIQGHLEKADHNLKFLQSGIRLAAKGLP